MCGRRMSFGSSSSRDSRIAMRERRSVNSHDARSMIASDRRELMISPSIVESSTRLMSSAPARCRTGSAAPHRADRSPAPCAASTASRCSQVGPCRFRSSTAWRRRSTSAGSATLPSSTRAPSSTARDQRRQLPQQVVDVGPAGPGGKNDRCGVGRHVRAGYSSGCVRMSTLHCNPGRLARPAGAQQTGVSRRARQPPAAQTTAPAFGSSGSFSFGRSAPDPRA